MIGKASIIKELLRFADRAKNESFELHSSDWNKALEVYSYSRPLIVRGSTLGGWLHPWQFSLSWDDERGGWQARINSGFVNGVDAEVDVPTLSAPAETLERLGESLGSRVAARLSEEPLVPIPAALLRSIGPDAIATGAGGIGERITFEQVPEYFAALGVGDPPEQTLDSTRGIVTSIDFANQESLKLRRLLRAVEVTLTVDRPSVSSDWSTGSGLNGSVAQFDVGYSSTGNERTSAYLGFTSRYEPAPEGDPLARLLGSFKDDPFDRLHVATIYFMSPTGADEGAEVSREWQTFVKHRIFWNLNHALNRLPVKTASENTTFDIPLAGGIGNALINTFLSTNNDALDAANEFLNSRSLAGRFWST